MWTEAFSLDFIGIGSLCVSLQGCFYFILVTTIRDDFSFYFHYFTVNAVYRASLIWLGSRPDTDMTALWCVNSTNIGDVCGKMSAMTTFSYTP